MNFQPYIRLHNQSSPVKSSTLAYDYDYDMKDKSDKIMAYPPETKAFLYYFSPPGKPRIAGELRLRIASSDDPSSFESGSDLMKINGQAWSRPLFTVSRVFFPLYEKLREELLVPDELDTVLSTLPHGSLRYRRGRPLYTLNDTFIVNFNNVKQRLTVITEQGTMRLRLEGLFSEVSASYLHIPYTGEYHLSTSLY